MTLQEHTVRAFDTDIAGMRCAVFEMGALAERQFRRSVHAMITGDPGLIAQVLADERVGDEAKKIALKGRTGLEAANKPTTRPDPAPAMLAVLMYGCASRRRLGPAR